MCRLDRICMSLVWIFQVGISSIIVTLAIDRISMQYYGLPPVATIYALLAGLLGTGAGAIGILSPYPSIKMVPVVLVLGVNALSFAVYFLGALIYSIGLRSAKCSARWTSGEFVTMSHNSLLNLGALLDEGTTTYGYMQLRNPRTVLRTTCEKSVAMQSLMIAAFMWATMTGLVTWLLRRRMVAGPLAQIAQVVRDNGMRTRPYMLMDAVRSEKHIPPDYDSDGE